MPIAAAPPDFLSGFTETRFGFALPGSRRTSTRGDRHPATPSFAASRRTSTRRERHAGPQPPEYERPQCCSRDQGERGEHSEREAEGASREHEGAEPRDAEAEGPARREPRAA